MTGMASEWVALCIEKSKKVGAKINIHVHQVTDKTSFSMKLMAGVHMHGQDLK
jgi:hypothetical protein